MKETDNTNVSTGPFSFVKGVTDKIVGKVFHGAPREGISKQLEETKQEIKSLKACNEKLTSKWQLIQERFNDAALIETELKRIGEERTNLTGEISRKEEDIRALYATKDECLKESESLREDLEKILEEKRTVQSETAPIKKQEGEVEQLKEQLDQAKAREQEMADGFEEIEMKVKFASANMETLILDSTAAQKAFDNLERTVENKKESRVSLEKSKLAIDEIITQLDELKTAQENAGVPLQKFKAAYEQLKQIREYIKRDEAEYGAIPRKIAELNVTGGRAREKAGLLQKEKSLTARILEWKEKEKKIIEEAQKNESVVEKVEQASLEVKRLMMSAGLNEFVARVDSPSLDILKVDIETKREEIVSSLASYTKEISEGQTSQTEKRAAIAKMCDELKALSRDAERDKHDVERQREKFKKTKGEIASLRSGLETKLREKSASMSESLDATMELKRVEIREADAVNEINRIQAEVESVEKRINDSLSTMSNGKTRLEELGELEKFFTENLETVRELERLKSADKELALARDVAAKYEADCRKFKDAATHKELFESKLALVDETGVAIPVLESRLFEMREEQRQLEKELEPLRAEIGFVVEKRDNIEMEISFARESLKKAAERKKSLKRRLEFVTQESGSIKNIQEKLAVCENRLNTAQSNIAEIQTRLNFTTATEEVVKENFQKAQDNIKKMDKQIESIKSRLEEKEVQLPDLRAKISEYEQKIDDKKGEKLEEGTSQASFATDLKKTTIECDSLTEKVKHFDAPLQENKKKESSIEALLPSYNVNLEKQKKIDGEIEDAHKETDKVSSRLAEFKTQVADLQDKKRELMDESLGFSEKRTEEVSVDKEKVTSLRDERKTVRGQLKDLEAKIKESRGEGAQGSSEVDALRKERDALRKKIDKINEQLDAVKGGGPVTVSTPSGGEAKNLAAAIGELDIKVLTLTKSIDKVEPELAASEKKFEDLTRTREELSLEIADQKSTIAPLDEIKKKIASMEGEKNAAQKALDDKLSQNEVLTQKIKGAKEGMESVLKAISDAESGLSQTRGEVETIEANTSGLRVEFDKITRDKESTLSEFNRLKVEMDSIMVSAGKDRDMIEKEQAAAEEARKEVEETRKQLTEAMSILTGKTGSVDSLKLEVSSSADEERDISDRINFLAMERKSVTAAIDGIETSREPRAERLKYIAWAQGIINGKIESLRFRAQLEEIGIELKELKDTRELYDEYNDLSRSREELQKRVGKLKTSAELETKLMAAEQARHEAMAQVSENAEKIELQEAMIKSMEEKYRDSEEDRVRIKGMSDEISTRFEMARKKWGKIEDLARMADSLELKIRGFRDQFGSMERVVDKADCLEKENTESIARIKGLEDTCHTLYEEKKSLETALEKTKGDFEGALQLVRKSRDEVRKFLYSEV